MAQDLKVLGKEAKNAVQEAKTLKELDGVFRMYLGRKGELTRVLKSLSKLKKAQRMELGKAANELRDFLQAAFERKKCIHTLVCYFN